MNRRSAILTSLAGPFLWAQAFDSKYSYSATSQKDDEGGYQESSEAERQAEEREKDILPLGNSAPAWLRNAEVYSGWYAEFSDNVLRNWFKDFPLIIGVPTAKSCADRAHRLGIRVIPYISFYKALDLQVIQELGVERAVGETNYLPNPFWREFDLSKHPEWKLYDKEGRVRRPFNAPDYPPAWSEVCTASPGYADAALKGVQALLELGFDGLFVDNVHPTPHCYGPAFGKHTHVNGMDNGEAFRNLITDVYALVKKNSSKKILALNPGHVNPIYWPSCDAMMYESYICNSPYVCSKGWDPIIQKAKNCQRAIRSSKVVLALSYFSELKSYGSEYADFNNATLPQTSKIMEDAFYSYACARLSGFHWSDYFTLPRNRPAQALYKVRLGRLIGDMEEIESVYIRRFQHGVVMVNSSGETKQIQIPRLRTTQLRDIYSGNVIEVRRGSLPVEISGETGRVYGPSVA